jgi:signal peptidase II
MEFVIIAIGLILDRVSKIWAQNFLTVNGDVVILNNIFSFSYLENRGAAFGIFQNKQNILAIVTLFVLCFIIFYLVKYRPRSIILRISLSLIICGAIGNLVDRVTKKYVVDFILFHYKDVYYFPTFNVADMMVVIGTFSMALYLIKEDKNENL